jgi:hypothetical protein
MRNFKDQGIAFGLINNIKGNAGNLEMNLQENNDPHSTNLIDEENIRVELEELQ